jgi:protocatechuate 3,4-dioxygenase beta subunit
MSVHSPAPSVDDDQPVGRVLSRREVLALLGAAGVTVVASTYAPRTLAQSEGSAASPVATDMAGAEATIPACVISPELTEGPYFVDTGLERSDIRSDPASGVVSEGLPLALTFLVSRLDGTSCLPLEGALVDVWHCDALGVYSGVQGPGFDTSGQQFLRGAQRTDAAGRAAFTTIYPGWYTGRAVHIHFKIRTDPDAEQGLELTSQLFFDDALSAAVYAEPPYAQKGTQDTPNDQDMIFAGGGEVMMLALEPTGDGYAAVFPIGVLV